MAEPKPISMYDLLKKPGCTLNREVHEYISLSWALEKHNLDLTPRLKPPPKKTHTFFEDCVCEPVPPKIGPAIDGLQALANLIASHRDGRALGRGCNIRKAPVVQKQHDTFSDTVDGVIFVAKVGAVLGGLGVGFFEGAAALAAVAAPDIADGVHTLAINKLARAVPNWVSADDADTRVIEGRLHGARITFTDMPLGPWHVAYDWNYYVRPDKQYNYLQAVVNREVGEGGTEIDIMECEWDSSSLIEPFAFPHFGDRVLFIGRWIYDCGHPYGTDAESDTKAELIDWSDPLYRAEIHPPKIAVIFRTFAIDFGGKLRAANNALIWMNQNGGYWQHGRLDAHDCAFELYLPPRPTDDAVATFAVVNPAAPDLLLPTDMLPVVTFFPAADPRVARVVFPFKGKNLSQGLLGCRVSVFWDVPKKIGVFQKLRVAITALKIVNAPMPGQIWTLVVGVGTTWRAFALDVDGEADNSFPLDFVVDMALEASDKFRISVFARGDFETTTDSSFMGVPLIVDKVAVSWDQVVAASQDPMKDMQIREAIFATLLPGKSLEPTDCGYATVELAADKEHDAVLRAIPDSGGPKGGMPRCGNSRFAQLKQSGDLGPFELAYTVAFI